ncbi:MAG: homoserine dehydrogenase [Methanomicrobiales archaeon]|nr:homoserine dehydrogenase [Methanomicrobiales archaeon]
MRIAMIGFGTVGQGIASVLMRKDLGLTITAIADSRSGLMRDDGVDLAGVLERKRGGFVVGDVGISPMDVVKRGEYDLLVEVSPTNIQTAEPAATFIREAISRGKHVVSSNKGPIALHLKELRRAALSHGVQLRYEATVCGAIPIMHVLEEGLRGNSVKSLHGVLNGTSNFILTRMAEEGLTYDQALAEAREMGVAEADPTYDVKGIDAAIKLVILSNTIWETDLRLEDVVVTGIDQITPDAIRLSEDEDATIRLIAEAIPERGICRVTPRLIPRNHPLVVNGTLNAITLTTDLAGALTFVGKGAGSIETASAVIGDILHIKERYARGA